MNILLTGAGGFIGRHLAPALAAAGHRLRPLSRRHGGDFARLLTAADWLPLLHGMDAVVNCVGLIAERGKQRFDTLHHRAPAALFEACAQAGARRVIQISALGADAHAGTAFHRSKAAADEILLSLPLDGFVLRPALVHGRGGASAELLMQLAALPLLPVVGDDDQALQPIHIDDVVAAVLRALTATETRLTLDLVGPETHTLGSWLARLRAAQGLPAARPLRIPLPAARACAHLARYLNPVMQPDTLRMLLSARAHDPAPFVRFLGRVPRIAEALPARSAP